MLQANDETTVLLKEVNARCISHLTTARGHIQLEMMKFADKLYAARPRTCTCCAARDYDECPPRAPTAPNGTSSFSTSIYLFSMYVL